MVLKLGFTCTKRRGKSVKKRERGQSQVLTQIGPIVGEESDKCGIIAESGEDVAWDEASESLRAWE